MSNIRDFSLPITPRSLIISNFVQTVPTILSKDVFQASARLLSASLGRATILKNYTKQDHLEWFPDSLLIIVEGKRSEPRLVRQMMNVYGLNIPYEIFSFKDNLYSLHTLLFAEPGEKRPNIQRLLLTRAKTERDISILNKRYSDILLIFDFDPQDSNYDENDLEEMMVYFANSNLHGKLYLNYPMVEAFHHLKYQNDREFLVRKVKKETLERKGGYKRLVAKESLFKSLKKYPSEKSDWDFIIEINIEKSARIVKSKAVNVPAAQRKIAHTQMKLYKQKEELYVLCTCIFFIYEYDSRLLGDSIHPSATSLY